MSASSSEPARAVDSPRRALLALAALAILGACGVADFGPPSPDASLVRACQNGEDDDGDGVADYPDDPGCESELDPAEGDPGTPRACGDGLDNDGDGRIDYDLKRDGIVGVEDDPGCESAADDDERNVVLPACSDGVDNDADGLTDFPVDPGCTSRNDLSEQP
jgi:hypothetical protein